MKEKILAALKTKYANLGFTDKEFDAAANYLTATVTTEDAIESAVSAVEPLLKSFQGFADNRVTTAVEKTKKDLGVDPPKPDPNQPAPPTPPANETPEAKMLRETFENLNKTLGTFGDRLTAIETGGVVTSRQTKLETALKDAPEAYRIAVLGTFDPSSFKDDAAFNDFFTKVTTTNLDAFNTKLGESGISNITPPTITPTVEGGKTSFKDNLKAGVDHMLAQKQGTTQKV